ncbi:MAG TPA: cytochrome b/b6 domain-containing protein [Burkholderiales bacterium]|nr:cytochrome b/b6 domain-containing protein [Burkholderiales bacterium]
MAPGPRHPVRVWDLPVRLFHWLLVALVISQIITASIGGNAMYYHERGGYTILALVLFRIAWGFLGSRHARFSDFVRGPAAVSAYAKNLLRGEAQPYAGHNPLGGWSVIAMLASLLLQASTGLFANDDVMLEGPLAKHVSKAVSDAVTRVHDVNAVVLLTLVCVHVAAVLYYLLARRENLIRPMLTGNKTWDGAPPAATRPALWRAAVLLLTAVGLVYLIVNL